jgi:hypothetical protein
MPVQHIGLFAHALEHAAVEQNFTTVLQGQQVFGTRYAAGSAVESNFHNQLV